MTNIELSKATSVSFFFLNGMIDNIIKPVRFLIILRMFKHALWGYISETELKIPKVRLYMTKQELQLSFVRYSFLFRNCGAHSICSKGCVPKRFGTFFACLSPRFEKHFFTRTCRN